LFSVLSMANIVSRPIQKTDSFLETPGWTKIHKDGLWAMCSHKMSTSRFFVCKWFIILPDELEMCDDEKNKCSESGQFFQVGVTQKWDNFSKAFCGCGRSTFCYSHLIWYSLGRPIGWIVCWFSLQSSTSRVIMSNIVVVGLLFKGWLLYVYYFFVCFLTNRLFHWDCCDVRLKRYYLNSLFNIFLFSQFLELFHCQICFLTDLSIRYFWFSWSLGGFQRFHNSLRLVFAINIK
jgi:hypothetical protein